MKQNQAKITEEYPFIIQADSLTTMPAFPTHTHGLTEVGMPEFIMDPLAFGPTGNGARINAAYKYFSDPRNQAKLKAILKGNIVKLTPKELKQDSTIDEPYTYCFREVSPDFEAVRQVYGTDIRYVIPKMRFIQIWVEGDDYALTDEYYRGGVTW